VPELADRIDLSSASAEDLCRLSGVGPALAERLVAWREDHGGFRSVDDLAQVRGIGERKLETLRPHVVARAPERPAGDPPRRFARPAVPRPGPSSPPRRFVHDPAPARAAEEPAPALATAVALLDERPEAESRPAAVTAPPRPRVPAAAAAAEAPPVVMEAPPPAPLPDAERRLDRFLVTLAVASQVLVLLAVLWVLL
jgi:competence ComEA-like helix-hairpin-helix protein